MITIKNDQVKKLHLNGSRPGTDGMDGGDIDVGGEDGTRPGLRLFSDA